MLVHLLVQGGIGFPSVAGSFWLLLALGLNLLEPEPAAAGRSVGHQFGPAATLGALGAAVVLAVAFYATAYSPVLDCRGALDEARYAPGRAERLLRAATEADPLDPEPRAKLASLFLARWFQTGEQPALEHFEQYNEAALALAPNDSTAWFQSGQWYFQLYQRTGRGRDLDRAIRSYQQAVALYPNSPLRRAELAMAHLAAGDQGEFAKEAAEALRLDQATPHADKKLDPAVRKKLSDALSRNTLSPN
jgi:tetratricopeptide (TPR) repeat protein